MWFIDDFVGLCFVLAFTNWIGLHPQPDDAAKWFRQLNARWKVFWVIYTIMVTIGYAFVILGMLATAVFLIYSLTNQVK